MTWQPIGLAELQALIERDLAECSDEQRAYFARVSFAPEKWSHAPEGELGGGFWAVAVDADRVLWYNDIEDGFNVSRFVRRGEIPRDEYAANQSPLRWALSGLRGASPRD
jgi:hypothetical protein